MTFPATHTMSQSPPASKSGFTLIELLITITIFGILLAIAIPNLSDLINGQRVKSAVSDLHASLIFARSEAIKRNHLVGICAKTDDGNGCENSADWARGWIVFLDADGNGLPGAVSDILKKQDTIPKVTLTGTASNVSYSRDGKLKAAVATFVASSPDNSLIPARCVILDLSGRPNIKADSNQNPSDGCQ